MENAIRISIHWEKQTFIGNPAIEIYLDSVKCGEVRSTETLVVNTSAGVHRLMFKYRFRNNTLDADFGGDTTVEVKLSRSSGDIVATQIGATPVQLRFDWMDKPRNDNTVYPDQLKVSPNTASILSVLVIGLGQMINGQLIKGLLMLVGAMFIGAITSGLAAPILWVISAIDAYMCANKLKQGQPIDRFNFF